MKIENLSVSYGKKQVIKNLNLEFNSKVTCLMGPSGCGKTTLMRAIGGLEKYSGSISPMPQNPSFMFQEDRLLPNLTARENIECVGGNADKLLELIEIDGSLYPDKMSGGMCRRVALARALNYGGDLLILDEPFKGLDERLVIKLADYLKNQPIPVLMSSHSPTEPKLMNAEIITLN